MLYDAPVVSDAPIVFEWHLTVRHALLVLHLASISAVRNVRWQTVSTSFFVPALKYQSFRCDRSASYCLATTLWPSVRNLGSVGFKNGPTRVHASYHFVIKGRMEHELDPLTRVLQILQRPRRIATRRSLQYKIVFGMDPSLFVLNRLRPLVSASAHCVSTLCVSTRQLVFWCPLGCVSTSQVKVMKFKKLLKLKTGKRYTQPSFESRYVRPLCLDGRVATRCATAMPDYLFISTAGRCNALYETCGMWTFVNERSSAVVNAPASSSGDLQTSHLFLTPSVLLTRHGIPTSPPAWWHHH